MFKEEMKNLNEFIELDKWQEEVILESSSHIAIRAGRQVGKSTVVSLKAALYALQNPKKTVLIIASVDRQAQLLFEKVVETILFLDKSQVGTKKDKPTKHYMKLKNGTKIHCLPTGRSGYGIRGYTVDLLIADEAAFIPEEVWVAVVPMLATTKGRIILLSTPFGRSGYFYECFQDKDYKTWAISSEKCERIPKEFLEKQKAKMTKLQYAQEFKGEFLEELKALFSRDLIDSCMSLDSWIFKPLREYYLGVDVARYGGDENAFVVIEYIDKDNLKLVNVQTTDTITTADTIERIIELNRIYNFRKIYIDDGGLGAPILDVLLENSSTKSKIIGINNASRSIEAGFEGRKKKLLKEDLYGNLLRLMEQGKITMIKNINLLNSLLSIQFEYTDDKNLKIWGKYSHITEAAIRAAWCAKDKGLKLFVA
jgi:hypothetical protein